MTAMDADTFNRLYITHRGPVFGLALSRTRDRGLAEDITAETFIRAWQRMPAGMDNPKSWLCTVAINLVLDHHKSARSRRTSTMAEVPDTGARDRDPEQTTIARETGRQLRAAVETLTPRQRQATQLRYWNGYTPPQIAVAVGMSEAGVKSRLHRSLEALRDQLTDSGAAA